MKRKQKRQRFALIVVIFIAVITTGIVMLTKKSGAESMPNDKITKNQDENVNNDKNDNNAKSDTENKFVDFKITPDGYTTNAGEEIDVKSVFSFEAIYENGESKDISEDVIFEFDKEMKYENGKLSIPETASSKEKYNIIVKYKEDQKSIEIKIVANLEDTLDQNNIVTNPEALDMIVNKNRNLSKDYVPPDLVTLEDVPTCLENPEVNQLRKEAYEALKVLFKKAEEEKGHILVARSGYRSYNTQKSVYSSYVANFGQDKADKYSAKPGQSEHQTGWSIDITSKSMNYQLDDTFGSTEEGIWVAENAHKYGFIIRYQKGKEDITGYSYEPWHIRYLGTELSQEVYESGLTLEEYFEKQ